MNKSLILQIIKITLGTTISMIIAAELNLIYPASAGIITLLSIQSTKKETIMIFFKRFVTFIIMTMLSYILFNFIGHNFYVFGIFLLIFITVCFFMKLKEAIAMNVVLATHFLIQQTTDLNLILNEFLLFIIGACIGITINLYMPETIKLIKKEQIEIDNYFKLTLNEMARYMSYIDKSDYSNNNLKFLHKLINISIKDSNEKFNNSLLKDTSYYVEYMQMRKNQYYILESIYKNIISLSSVPNQTENISNFFLRISNTFNEYNNAIFLIEELKSIKNNYKKDELPKERLEFEDRAILFYILNEIEQFLIYKRNFVMNLTEYQLKTYWNKKTTAHN